MSLCLASYVLLVLQMGLQNFEHTYFLGITTYFQTYSVDHYLPGGQPK